MRGGQGRGPGFEGGAWREEAGQGAGLWARSPRGLSATTSVRMAAAPEEAQNLLQFLRLVGQLKVSSEPGKRLLHLGRGPDRSVRGGRACGCEALRRRLKARDRAPGVGIAVRSRSPLIRGPGGWGSLQVEGTALPARRYDAKLSVCLSCLRCLGAHT